MTTNFQNINLKLLKLIKIRLDNLHQAFYVSLNTVSADFYIVKSANHLVKSYHQLNELHSPVPINKNNNWEQLLLVDKK